MTVIRRIGALVALLVVISGLPAGLVAAGAPLVPSGLSLGPCAASVGYPRHDGVGAGVAGESHWLDLLGVVHSGRRG